MTKKVALVFTMLVVQIGLFSSQALSSSSAVTVNVNEGFNGLSDYNESEKVLRVRSYDVNVPFRVHGSIVKDVPTINVEKYVADDENPELKIRPWFNQGWAKPSPVHKKPGQCSSRNAEFYNDISTFPVAVNLNDCFLKIHNSRYHMNSKVINLTGDTYGGCNFEMESYAAIRFEGPSNISASPHAHLFGALLNNLPPKYAGHHEGGTSELNPLKSVVLKSNGRLANSNPRQFDTVLRGFMHFGDAMIFDLKCLGGELTFNFG